MSNVMHARMDLLLDELKLTSMRRGYVKIAKEVTTAGGDYLGFLLALLEEEARDRHSRRISRCLKEARFRQPKLLAELDPEALPEGITIQNLNQLAQGQYLDDGENIVAIGSSGTGKTHISIGLGIAACEQGKRVKFMTATGLVSELEEAQEQKRLHRYLTRIGRLDLLIVDELGYLPMSERAADLLFQAFSERHERGSVIVNSNLPFSEWGQVFRTERLAVALLDRLTHKAHILEMNGESYRLRSARERKNSKSKRTCGKA